MMEWIGWAVGAIVGGVLAVRKIKRERRAKEITS